MTTAAAGNRGSRTRFKVALVLAVVLVGLMVPTLDAGASVGSYWSSNKLIMDSIQPTRSPASQLDGAKVSGTIAVFANVKSARSVKFWVDDPYRKGTPIRRDTAAPFDLMGTAADGTAVLFNTGSLADGTHTLTIDANYSYSNNLVQSARFQVQNVGRGSRAADHDPAAGAHHDPAADADNHDEATDHDHDPAAGADDHDPAAGRAADVAERDGSPDAADDRRPGGRHAHHVHRPVDGPGGDGPRRVPDQQVDHERWCAHGSELEDRERRPCRGLGVRAGCGAARERRDHRYLRPVGELERPAAPEH